MDIEATGFPIPGDAAADVAHAAHEEIHEAVNAAHEHIEDAAAAIEETARETGNAAILSSLADLHAAMRELVSRQPYDPGALASINASLERVHSRLDELSGPAREAAAAAIAAAEHAVDAAAETANETAADAGVPVAIPEPTELPAGVKQAKKSLFGKKKR